MKNKVLSLILSAVLAASMLSACGKTEEVSTGTPETTEETQEEVDDQALADECAALIDAIYVQQRTDETDAQCKAAKEAWDALTDAQKALVEGENADPDYFGRDTGDASLDNPLNQEPIDENEILVVSFGTSFNDSRVEDIGGIEKIIASFYPTWAVRRAFTAQIIINHIQARDGECIDNMDQALERAVANGVKNLVVQPTHLMHGAEYDELCEALANYQDKIENIVVAEPLLGAVGEDATVINEDKNYVARAVVAEANVPDDTALVLMGHGTSHTAKVSYSQMQTQMEQLGYDNVFVGTVEGEPEGTSAEEILEKVKEAGYKKVVLRPFMVVAGDHANNDMAGDDEDSWLSIFNASGEFDSVETQIEGLGRIDAIQSVYVQHTGAAIEQCGTVVECSDSTEPKSALADGTYKAKFTTDSSMFHVNEANEDMGDLTVKDGKMTIHVSLAGKGVTNLYLGLADDAKKEGAELLQPTTDTVTYSDGTSEEVYGFDIPVPYLDEEFDLALIGKKEVWYDHKVKVTEAQPIDY